MKNCLWREKAPPRIFRVLASPTWPQNTAWQGVPWPKGMRIFRYWNQKNLAMKDDQLWKTKDDPLSKIRISIAQRPPCRMPCWVARGRWTCTAPAFVQIFDEEEVAMGDQATNGKRMQEGSKFKWWRNNLFTWFKMWIWRATYGCWNGIECRFHETLALKVLSHGFKNEAGNDARGHDMHISSGISSQYRFNAEENEKASCVHPQDKDGHATSHAYHKTPLENNPY